MLSKMKLKYSKILPPPGFYAITIFNCIYRNPKYKNRPISKVTVNHELIHFAQARDFVFGCEKLYILGYILFYAFYFIEWLLKLIVSIFTPGKVNVYKSISFEQEAYLNEKNYDYLNSRNRWEWIKYIFNLKR